MQLTPRRGRATCSPEHRRPQRAAHAGARRGGGRRRVPARDDRLDAARHAQPAASRDRPDDRVSPRRRRGGSRGVSARRRRSRLPWLVEQGRADAVGRATCSASSPATSSTRASRRASGGRSARSCATRSRRSSSMLLSIFVVDPAISRARRGRGARFTLTGLGGRDERRDQRRLGPTCFRSPRPRRSGPATPRPAGACCGSRFARRQRRYLENLHVRVVPDDEAIRLRERRPAADRHVLADQARLDAVVEVGDPRS